MEDAKENDVKIEIEAMLAREVSPWTRDCCIYRVPYALRKLNEDAFTPTVVSIGPFHYGNPRLQSMERHKQVYFQRFMQRTQANLNRLVDKVEELEPRIRRSYSEIIVKPEKKELIKLMVVDACFILELFLPDFYEGGTENENILIDSGFISHINMDLLLLENQLPFFVLEELFNLAFSAAHQSGSVLSLLKLTFDYFHCHNKWNLVPRDDVTIKHFTDMLRTFHLTMGDRTRSDRNEMVTLKYSATKLCEAGVKFKKDETNKCLLDLKFSRSQLRIPGFTVEDPTEILFRNMVALEQCLYYPNSYISDYVCMIDDLISTSEDVDVLIHNGIICNMLGDNKAVAKLFGSLTENVTRGNDYADYNDICKGLNDFCENPYNKIKATLRRDYCRTPWQIVASCAGILLLILTIIQTLCSILQVDGMLHNFLVEFCCTG